MKMEHRQNDTDGGEWQYFEKKLSQCHFNCQNPTLMGLELNPAFHNERQATNSLSLGLALLPV